MILPLRLLLPNDRKFKLVKSNKLKKHQLSPDAKSKNIITYEKNIKRAWNTTDISKSGIIGDPTKASALKGKKILEVTSNNLKKIITEMN